MSNFSPQNPADNRRYFYQLDGEGIRYELVAFMKAIGTGKDLGGYISKDTAIAISRVMEQYTRGEVYEII